MVTKILIPYHASCALPDDILGSDVFLPVAVGDKKMVDKDALRDDIGENIAEKNPEYNELTAVYFAWKNYDKIGDPDYIGLNHYRRFFIYDDRKYAYYETKDGSDLFQKIKYDKGVFYRFMTPYYDFIAPMPNKRRSVYDNFAAAHGKEDLDDALRIIREKFPWYALAAQEYVAGKAAYFYNAFLFKKETFFRYCEFLFGVLAELEKVRVGGRMFVSEVLTGIFFTKLKNEGEKELRLPILFIGKKPSFSQSVAQTKKNFAKKEGSFIYRIKPMIVFFTPNFLLLSRKKKTVR